MDESKAIEQVAAAYDKLLRQSGRIRALEKKLSEGTITMKEGAELNDLRAKAFGRAFSGSVTGIERGSREGACVGLLKDRCGDVDELALAAQKTALTRQGLNITPPTAPFEEERARKIGRSLEDETVPDETIQRRARSATETMLRSQYDRDMERGAETCASAGLKTYIVRDADPGCCKWCSEAAGRYTYGEEPKDVYRRHDNCSCTVVYESGRGKQNVWSKQNWSAEQEQKYLELRDELKAKKRTEAPNVKKPVRLSEKDVQAIMAKVGGLTFGQYSDILSLSDSSSIYDFVSDRAASNVPYLDIFGEHGETSRMKRLEAATLNVRHKQASSDLLKYIRADEQICLANDPDYEPGVEYSIVYDANMQPIKGREKPQKYEQGRCEIKAPTERFHAFHNHGSSETLGYTDINGFSTQELMISITAQGNNGKNKFTLLKTASYDKHGYNAFLFSKSKEPFFEIEGVQITLEDCSDENLKEIINDAYSNLSSDEQARFRKALVDKTEECLRGGNKYGVKYISSKT